MLKRTLIFLYILCGSLGKANGVETWGAGVDYTFAKNAQFQVMQSFASKSKDSNASDPDELTRAQFVFAF